MESPIWAIRFRLVNQADIDSFVENIFNFPALPEAYRIAALDIVGKRKKRTDHHGMSQEIFAFPSVTSGNLISPLWWPLLNESSVFPICLLFFQDWCDEWCFCQYSMGMPRGLTVTASPRTCCPRTTILIQPINGISIHVYTS